MKFLKDFVQFYQTQDSIIFWSISSSVLISLIIILLWAINIYKLPQQIPLFYSQPWGENQLADLPQFIVLPALVILTVLINLIISWHLHPSQIILKRILSFSSLIVSFLILITAFKIIYIFV